MEVANWPSEVVWQPRVACPTLPHSTIHAEPEAAPLLRILVKVRRWFMVPPELVARVGVICFSSAVGQVVLANAMFVACSARPHHVIRSRWLAYCYYWVQSGGPTLFFQCFPSLPPSCDGQAVGFIHVGSLRG